MYYLGRIDEAMKRKDTNDKQLDTLMSKEQEIMDRLKQQQQMYRSLRNSKDRSSAMSSLQITEASAKEMVKDSQTLQF